MAKKYKFTTHEELQGRFIRCPKCGELLSPSDVEYYNACPYCSTVLERNHDFEDFIVEQSVQGWMSIFNNARPDGRRPR